jgi:hypothetical protein
MQYRIENIKYRIEDMSFIKRGKKDNGDYQTI